MKKSTEHADEAGQYKIPAHHPITTVRRSRWGIVAGSLFSVAGVVALITLTGTGGATANVPLSLQVGAQAATTTVAPTTVPPTTLPRTTLPRTAVPSTTVPPTTAPPTTVASTVPATTAPPSTVPPTTAPPTTVPSRPTTTVTTPLSIVVPKSKVSEGGVAGGDDSSHRTGTSSTSTDN